jgi:teichuronic acid biosynthesis glycosyltransferase TuaH
MKEFKELPLVMVSMSRWDGDFSSASWSLAKTFAMGQPVIYVDYPFTVLDFWRERKLPRVKTRRDALLYKKRTLKRLSQYPGELYALTPPLMLPVNWLPKGKLYQQLSSINDRRLAASINKALKELGYSECIFFNSFNPLYLTQPFGKINFQTYIYQSRDNIRGLEPYLSKHGAEAEVNAIRQAGLSIATSRQLQKELSLYADKEVAYVPNAADFETFKKAFRGGLPVPDDLEDIPSPRIGYTGNICHRLDYELIQSICKAHPEKNLVMVGPRNHWESTTINLDEIENLHFLGPKSIEQLPSYLAHFDVLILPFLCNEVTKSIYPLKINEYLASGKPVVATPFSEDITGFEKIIEIAGSPKEFVMGIEEGIFQDNPERKLERYKIAEINTWQHRVQQIIDLVS